MSQTIQNLTKAFVGESQARNRYTMYASTARKEGFLQIADIFEETANQEKEHASRFFKMIQMIKAKENTTQDEITIETGAFVKAGTTIENLTYAVAGETHEYESMYPEFAKIAREEGYPEIAARIDAISIAEQHHAERYQKLANELTQQTLRNKSTETERVCTKCGHIHRGTTPSKICPSCSHDETYAIVKNEIY